MSIRAVILAGIVCISAVLMTACVPKYAKESDVVEYVKANVPEEVELVGETEGKEHTWTFQCVNRDMTFTASTAADSISIDGSFFGYTGDYTIGCNYKRQLYAYYNDTMNDILRRNNILGDDETIFDYDASRKDLLRKQISTSDSEFDYCDRFVIVLDNNTYDWDCKYASAFLEDIRKEIVLKEYERTGQTLEYKYEIQLRHEDNSGVAYQRCVGTNSDYSSSIEPDREVDVHSTVSPCNQFCGNVISPVRNGMLIYLSEREYE